MTILKSHDLFCSDLPTHPLEPRPKILIAGATGYVGGRLVFELQKRGYPLRLTVRGNIEAYKRRWPTAEIVTADVHKYYEIESALRGVDVAYYLVHSLNLGPKAFETSDLEAADNFRQAVETAGVKRIIYLGGLGEVGDTLSHHLSSRIDTSIRLMMGKVPVTTLRAAVVIGSGGSSYEIIHHLVKRMPVMMPPPWARKSRCHPIALRDVVKYLVGVLETPETANGYFDIGGTDVLTYESMLKEHAKLLKRKIFFFPLPFNAVPLYSYIAALVTPTPYTVIRCLFESLQNDAVCNENRLRQMIPFTPLSYREQLLEAMTPEEKDWVHSHWTDSYPPAHDLAMKLSELKNSPRYQARYSLTTQKSAEALYACISKIGGQEGWFFGNWLWYLRGFLDKLLLGTGNRRGRRVLSRLEVNDVIDYWRVEDCVLNERILLRTEMKLPGKAWLEFLIEKEPKSRLTLTAYFDTRSLFGSLYWYLMAPLHHYIFNGLIKEIEKRSIDLRPAVLPATVSLAQG